MELTWLGHASFLCTVDGKRIVVDPYAGGKESYIGKADIILITHEHYDHFSREIVEEIRNDETLVVAPQSVARQLHDVRVVQPGQNLSFKSVTLTVVPAYNIGKHYHERNAGGVGYIFTVNGVSVYHAGDTDYIPEMNDINVDVALLPVGGTYTMNADDASRAVRMMQSKFVIPMHWGTIVGTRDDADTFADLVKNDAEPIILDVGKPWVIP